MLMMLPGLKPEELMNIQNLTQGMSETQLQQFYVLYQGKRKEQQTLLLLTLLGFIGFAGIHRFVVGQIGWGIIYFLTAGFCCIGTIIDLVNIGEITSTFNQKQAYESVNMVTSMMK